MTVWQVIPAGLGQMAPGPELGALLAGIDIHALTGNDAVEVLQARVRQLSHEQALVLATLVEVVRVGLSTLLGRDEHPGEVPGWGPVPAGVARTMVTAHWRYAITDATRQTRPSPS